MKSCPICQNKQYEVIYKFGARKIVVCTNCRLVRTVGKQKVNYKNYHRDADYKQNEKLFRNIFTKRYKIASKFVIKPGRVLDIGTSTGTMLDIFKEKGWETWGVEPSENYNVAKQKGHRIINKNFETAKLESDFFDLVIMNHTLEHVDDPVIVIEKVNKILKKDGIVLVDVPNFGSLSSKILKQKWPFILPDEHNYHFTAATLKRIIIKNNFEVIFVRSRSGLWDFGNPLLEIFQAFTGLKKRLSTDILGLPGATISTMLNMGTSITVLGKKKWKN